MVTINNRKTILSFFSYLNKEKNNYVWLHGYNNQHLGDIDIAMAVNDFNSIDIILADFCKSEKFNVIQMIQHEKDAKYFVLIRNASANNFEYLIIDVCTDYKRDGRILLDINKLLENRHKKAGFYVCNKTIEALYIFLKRSLKGEWAENHYLDFINLYANNKRDIEKHLGNYLSNKNFTEFNNCINKNDFELLNEKCIPFKKNILEKTFWANPFNTLKFYSFDFIRKIKRIIKPTGFFIVLMGPDGSGKSTIATHLQTNLSPVFRKTSTFHWRPNVFNKKDNKVAVGNPHAYESRGKFHSFLKLLYYVIDYLIGYYVKILPAKIKSTLIIFDRYYYDFLMDKTRYRMDVPEWLIKIFIKVIPTPDIVFFLEGDPKILYERKKEIDVDEIKAQIHKSIEIEKLLSCKFARVRVDVHIDETLKVLNDKCIDFLNYRLLK